MDKYIAKRSADSPSFLEALSRATAQRSLSKPSGEAQPPQGLEQALGAAGGPLTDDPRLSNQLAKVTHPPAPAEGYWLPEVFTLRLTALEAGALMAILATASATDYGSEFMVNVRGRKKPMRMDQRLMEKLEREVYGRD